mgnify:CR=1 FL=1
MEILSRDKDEEQTPNQPAQQTIHNRDNLLLSVFNAPFDMVLYFLLYSAHSESGKRNRNNLYPLGNGLNAQSSRVVRAPSRFANHSS